MSERRDRSTTHPSDIDPITETFDEACESFVAFLRKNGKPTNVRWICGEDLFASGRRWYVRRDLPSENDVLMRGLFELGARRGLGVVLEAFLYSSDVAWSYVWVPADAAESSSAMMGGLHLKTHESAWASSVRSVGPLGFAVRRAMASAAAIMRLGAQPWCSAPSRALLRRDPNSVGRIVPDER